MPIKQLFFQLLLLLLFFTEVTPQPELVHSWVVIDYAWRDSEQQQRYIRDGLYIPQNNSIAGIKLYQKDIFVTVPRWRDGVPSTLNRVIVRNNTSLLDPYPSWDMQEIGNDDALQYIQSMEIDTRGWMWILDVARINLEGTGNPKLLIWDINRNCTIRKYYFPDEILPHGGSFANDIVVDESTGFAYITDTWGQGGLVIYDFTHNTARRFDNDPSLAGNASNNIIINGKGYPITSPSDGIALSDDSQTLYYSALSRQYLYSVATFLLQDFNIPNQVISNYIQTIGVKGYSDGMTYDNVGRLYFGDLQDNAVKVWNTSSPLSTAEFLAWNNDSMQWPDTFAWDNSGYLYFVSNKLEKFLFNLMVFDGSDGDNFRIWRIFVNAKSYISSQIPNPPVLPCSGL